MRTRAAVLAAVSLVATAGCAKTQNSADDVGSGACVSPLAFEGRRYIFVPTQNGYAKPGEEIGKGTFEPCADGDLTDAGGATHRVFGLPDVPPEEAVVLRTPPAGDQGTIYRLIEEPERGWDPDLQVWLDRARVQKNKGKG